MKTTIVVVIFFILAALHQDFWNWDNRGLVLGFIPVGLAYHAGYSLVAALFWYLVSQFAWPHKTEEWAEK